MVDKKGGQIKFQCFQWYWCIMGFTFKNLYKEHHEVNIVEIVKMSFFLPIFLDEEEYEILMEDSSK